MWIRPTETVGLVWQVSDPSDVTTYFPQVVIKNARDNTTITTVNLSLITTGRYQGIFVAPADSSGQGYYLDETLKVYTDSIHTTLSQNYNIENRRHLVATRPKVSYGATETAAKELDYSKLKKELLADLLAVLPKSEPIVFPDTTKQIKKIVTLVTENLDTFKLENATQLTGLSERNGTVEKVVKKLVDAISVHGSKTNEHLKNLSARFDEHDKTFNTLDSGVTKMDTKHNETLAMVRDAATQMQTYAKEQIDKAIKEFNSELRAVFDSVQVVQVAAQGRGLQRLEKVEKKLDFQEMANKIMSL